MNRKPTLSRPCIAAIAAAAALSAFISVGLLTTVISLFQRDGAPFERVVAAERACAHSESATGRETCVRVHLASPRSDAVAQAGQVRLKEPTVSFHAASPS